MVHGFCQKIENFVMGIVFGQIMSEKPFFDILDKKECFLDQTSKVLKQSQKLKFFQRVSPWFLSRNRIFFQGCLFGN